MSGVSTSKISILKPVIEAMYDPATVAAIIILTKNNFTVYLNEYNLKLFDTEILTLLSTNFARI